MTGHPNCPVCNGTGLVTAWKKKGRKGWQPVPDSPCLCVKVKK